MDEIAPVLGYPRSRDPEDELLDAVRVFDRQLLGDTAPQRDPPDDRGAEILLENPRVVVRHVPDRLPGLEPPRPVDDVDGVVVDEPVVVSSKQPGSDPGILAVEQWIRRARKDNQRPGTVADPDVRELLEQPSRRSSGHHPYRNR